MLLGLCLGAAWGAPVVGAVMEPDDVVAQYRLQATESGLPAAARELVCKSAAEGLQVCATVLSDSGWRYATDADPEVVKPTADWLRPQAGFRSKEVEGVGRYWVREHNDGREGLVFVRPDALKSITKVPMVAAWPVPGIIIAWVPGNPSLDQILSVGVAKMVEASNHPISAKLYRHDDKEWTVWGEAKANPSE
jgi:hypothetical protein